MGSQTPHLLCRLLFLLKLVPLVAQLVPHLPLVLLLLCELHSEVLNLVQQLLLLLQAHAVQWSQGSLPPSLEVLGEVCHLLVPTAPRQAFPCFPMTNPPRAQAPGLALPARKPLAFQKPQMPPGHSSSLHPVLTRPQGMKTMLPWPQRAVLCGLRGCEWVQCWRASSWAEVWFHISFNLTSATSSNRATVQPLCQK